MFYVVCISWDNKVIDVGYSSENITSCPAVISNLDIARQYIGLEAQKYILRDDI
jgi:hypothetical protein